MIYHNNACHPERAAGVAASRRAYFTRVYEFE